MKTRSTPIVRCAAAALGSLALLACLPSTAQTTTAPGTMKSSPGARDAQGHAPDSTAPMAHSQGTKMGSGKAATGAGAMKGSEPRTNDTPLNTTPGAGLRNSGNTVPPTSGAAGR